MIAVDHFAGTGWGVALQQLGIVEHGVELMPEAVATRELNGMLTTYCDVWDGLMNPDLVPGHRLAIFSPPCQTFSQVGRGQGTRALGQVIAAIEAGAYRDPELLRAVGEATDERTALVLTPLAHIWQHRPERIILEQVPGVLPVWHAYAAVLEQLGYSVRVALLQAEQFGVPQTRRRAILVARRDREAALPTPTHSRFHQSGRLDSGVLPWVPMIDAVGWGFTARPAPTQTGHGLATRQATGQQQVYRRAIADGTFVFRPPFTTADARRSDDPISLSRAFHPDAVNMNVKEAALVQSYPAGFEFAGPTSRQHLQVGNAVPPLLARAIIEAVL